MNDQPKQMLPEGDPLMLTIEDVAKMLQCSDRHVTNLRREGLMPPPVKLGVLVRWPRKTIEDWIAANCPAGGEWAA
jgi:excisionase family DNA binding protein